MWAAGRGPTLASLMPRTGSNSTAPPRQHRLPTPPAPPPQTARPHSLLGQRIGTQEHQETPRIIPTTRILLLEVTMTRGAPAHQEHNQESLVMAILQITGATLRLEISQIMLGQVVELGLSTPTTMVAQALQGELLTIKMEKIPNQVDQQELLVHRTTHPIIKALGTPKCLVLAAMMKSLLNQELEISQIILGQAVGLEVSTLTTMVTMLVAQALQAQQLELQEDILIIKMEKTPNQVDQQELLVILVHQMTHPIIKALGTLKCQVLAAMMDLEINQMVVALQLETLPLQEVNLSTIQTLHQVDQTHSQKMITA